MKRDLFIGLFALFLTLTPGYAQSSANATPDSVIVFTFAPQDDMFLAKGNETELSKLYLFVEQHKAEITSGQLPLYMNGYCASFDNEKQNLQTARIRSNRVKSELIGRGLKEENFITTNHAVAYKDNKDIVTVLVVVETGHAPSLPAEMQTEKVVEQPKKEVVPQVEQVEQVQPAKTETTPVIASESVETRHATSLQIRTNLLYWLATIPNLGVEWQPSNSVGILVNGAWNHWIWSSESHHYRTWFVSPEVRYYFGTGWFIGAEGHTGEFNFKFKDTGYQGDAIGGGLTGGYKLKLSRIFDLDFSLGLGYTQLEYDTYYRSRDVMVLKEGGLKKDFFGPTQAGVSLIWKIK
jgi:hypothetical protein